MRRTRGVQIIPIPAEFGFFCRRCAWVMRWATVVETMRARNERLAAERTQNATISGLSSLSADPYFGSHKPVVSRLLANMVGDGNSVVVRTEDIDGNPIDFCVEESNLPQGITAISRQRFKVFVGLQEEGDDALFEVEPWGMRDAFLKAGKAKLQRASGVRPKPSGGTQALLKFLQEWGVWGPVSSRDEINSASTFDLKRDFPRVLSGDGLQLGRIGTPQPILIFPSDLIALQAEFSRGLRSPAAEWISKSSLPSAKATRDCHPYYSLKLTNSRSCIEATITIDKLRNIKFQDCALDTCLNVFQVTPKKEHCSRACKDLARLRKLRAEEKASKGIPADSA